MLRSGFFRLLEAIVEVPKIIIVRPFCTFLEIIKVVTKAFIGGIITIV